MQVITPIEITPDSQIEVVMPMDAQILGLCLAMKDVYLICLVDPLKTREKRTFRFYINNESINGYPGRYIGSFFRNLEQYHCFELTAHAKAKQHIPVIVKEEMAIAEMSGGKAL